MIIGRPNNQSRHSWPVKERSFNVPLACKYGVNEAIVLRQLVIFALVAQHIPYGVPHKAKPCDFKKLVHNSKLINADSGYRVTLFVIQSWIPWASYHTCFNVTQRLRQDNLIGVAHTDKVLNDYSNHYFINFAAVKKWLKLIGIDWKMLEK